VVGRARKLGAGLDKDMVGELTRGWILGQFGSDVRLGWG
jgi:hypothetical protein